MISAGHARPAAELVRRVAAAVTRLADRALPNGTLPAAAFERRHAWVVRLVWIHVPVLVLYVILTYGNVAYAALLAGPVAAFALGASLPRFGPTLRASLATLGLLTASGAIVHLGSGLAELHFHFFVSIAVVALYQRRAPLLLAIGYVLLEHGIVGVLDPGSVFERPEAFVDPRGWALFHAAFVVAVSVASTIGWRFDERTQAVIERSRRVDGMTGALTRAAFTTEVGGLLHARSGTDVQVAVLNVDRFRVVNETNGEVAGDGVLAMLATRLRAAARDGVVGRLSGDEFAVAVPDHGNQGRPAAWAAGIVAETLGDGLELPDHRRIRLTVSAGVASGRAPGCDAEQLVANASAAMREGRRLATGGITEHTADLALRMKDARDLAADLASNDLEAQLRLHYQPIVATPSGVVHTVEALVRWDRPDRGLVAPGVFLAAAREAGRLRSIEEWVIGSACAQLRAWQDEGIETSIAINVSPQLYGDPHLVDLISSRIEASGADPSGLEIELPESLTVTDDPTIAPRLAELAGLGIRLLIDDFGAGYSYLPYLSRLPLWAIKLDRGLVAQAVVSAADGAVVQAVIVMAHRLGMRVVAEGVETRAQLTWLRAHGVDDAQGYLLGRPEPIDVVDRIVRAGPIDLPAHLSTAMLAAAPASPADPSEDTAARPSARVLIVEDEPLTRRLLRRHLERDGHHCEEAADAAAAMAAIAADPPDLVVLDLHLPDSRPDVVFQAVRGDSRTALIPIVVVSSELFDAPAGADGLLEKPVLADELRLVVRDALAAAGGAPSGSATSRGTTVRDASRGSRTRRSRLVPLPARRARR